MKAVTFHGTGDIRLEDVKDPKIQEPTDAIVRITASAICGTDLHFLRGTVGPMDSGTILGHEGVGIVEEVGKNVRNLKVGDRVVISSTIACGYCSYCRAGYFAKCDNANPNGKQAGTAYFGGPKETGPFPGLQAEYARIPFASVGLVKLPSSVTDDQAILLSDIFPTGYFGAELAEITPGDTVAVFGCGPVGQFAIASAKLMDAGRIFAIDSVASRLDMARDQGAEIINFEEEDPVEMLREFTGGIGVDRAIDAVGIDAYHPAHGPAARHLGKDELKHFEQETKEVTQGAGARMGGRLHAGDAPSQVLQWGIKACAKAGTFSIVGVYPGQPLFFPMGDAMDKSLTLKMGACNHRKYIPILLNLVKTGAVNPREILTQAKPFSTVLDAYKAFEAHQEGWIKVMLEMPLAA